SRRRHTRSKRDWSSDVCSSDLVAALRAALADGTIDIVATDHAPHPREAKDCEFAAAAMGMTGLETAVGVVAAAMIAPGEHEFTRSEERRVGKGGVCGRGTAE